MEHVFISYGTFCVWALRGMLTLTFDLLTSKLISWITCGIDSWGFPSLWMLIHMHLLTKGWSDYMGLWDAVTVCQAGSSSQQRRGRGFHIQRQVPCLAGWSGRCQVPAVSIIIVYIRPTSEILSTDILVTITVFCKSLTWVDLILHICNIMAWLLRTVHYSCAYLDHVLI